MSDFGADESFVKAAEKVHQHYGITVPLSAVRSRTQEPAEAMRAGDLETQLGPGGVAQLIAEMAGSMVPIVTFPESEVADSTKDKRKLRKTEWRQGRLLLVRQPGPVRQLYRATMREAEYAGAPLLDCAIAAGAGHKTRRHGLGDGAWWIVEQLQEQFGQRASFLVAFYHLSEYLAAAAAAIAAGEKEKWLALQPEKMKQNRVAEVVAELRAQLVSVSDEARRQPIQAGERYLSNRLAYVDYATALLAGLPIGSGEVESGHRSVIQARLKLSGAWWKMDNAEKMLALRTVRANGGWQSYWDQVCQAAA